MQMSKFPRPPVLLLSADDDVQLIEGIIGECDALGWRVINLYHQNVVDCSALQDPPVGAVIVRMKGNSSALRRMGVPIVRIVSPTHDEFPNDASLEEDRREGGRLAADAFAERGFREFGYVVYGPQNSPPDIVFVGFREQAERVHNASVHLCSFDDESKEPAVYYERFLEHLSMWLADRPKPLAVFAHNINMANRVLAACERAGLRVPEQIAIACRDNDDLRCRTALVPLSAIDMNRAELGRMAVQMVRRLANGEAPPRQIVRVPVKGFVARRSTDILAVSDPMVARAMRFMWDHIKRPLTVDDIACEVGASRATLERAFSRTLGRGIFAELRRKRLELCRELLRTTKMPLNDIARAVGDMSRRHLHRAFTDAYGMTPQQYRLSQKPKA
jgi:LacI family transcriptional regulator